ncbi:hypothetical protein HanPSC8_Chr09g0386951 [Helianthus annuus]|nr:hypothetical protein HanPSC8_Chr09g0386951 [Helianthus annuus]
MQKEQSLSKVKKHPSRSLRKSVKHASENASTLSPNSSGRATSS